MLADQNMARSGIVFPYGEIFSIVWENFSLFLEESENPLPEHADTTRNNGINARANTGFTVLFFFGPYSLKKLELDILDHENLFIKKFIKELGATKAHVRWNYSVCFHTFRGNKRTLIKTQKALHLRIEVRFRGKYSQVERATFARKYFAYYF